MRTKIRPGKPQLPAAGKPGQQDRQAMQRKYLASGGSLQGYGPEFVIRLTWIAGAISLLCLLMAVEVFLGPLTPGRGVWALDALAALGWLVVPVALASLVAGGARLAYKDRKADPRLVQGHLIGASSVSSTVGLGMVMVRTRTGDEQYFCRPEQVAKLPGNSVPVNLLVTPNLRHVKSVTLMGPRQVSRVEPSIPPAARWMAWLPVAIPLALGFGVLVVDEALSLAPLTSNVPLHFGISLIACLLTVGAIVLASRLVQQRVMSQLSGLIA